MLVPDLILAAEKLDKIRPDLAGAIRAIRDLNSIRTDLAHAHSFAQTMNGLSEAAKASAGDTVLERSHHALLIGAIVLYARATKTTSDHRRTFDFRSRFNDEQRVTHKLICDLRDDAVAHFGPGHQLGSAGIQKDGLFLAPARDEEGALRLMAVSQRIVINQRFGARMQEHLRRVCLLAQREFETREADLMVKLNECTDSPEVRNAIAESKTDLAEYMSSAELAQTVLDPNQIAPLVAVSNR